jgi:hypothetical protein
MRELPAWIFPTAAVILGLILTATYSEGRASWISGLALTAAVAGSLYLAARR